MALNISLYDWESCGIYRLRTKTSFSRCFIKAVAIVIVITVVSFLVGKIGAILASIPQALAAAVLCFMWALIVALGLSTLQYTQTASFRNITIVGVSLFLGFSIPAYFQQYLPESSLILPSYLIPYSAASDGPFHTGSKEVREGFNLFVSFKFFSSSVTNSDCLILLLVSARVCHQRPLVTERGGDILDSVPT